MKNVLIPVTTAIILMAGCESEEETEIPEVNDKNCLLENIKKLPNKSTRQELAGECSRRSLRETEPKKDPENWLNLLKKSNF